MTNLELLSNKMSMIGYNCSVYGNYLVSKRNHNGETETQLYITGNCYGIPKDVVSELEGDVIITGDGKLLSLRLYDAGAEATNKIQQLTLDIDTSEVENLKQSFCNMQSLREIHFKNFNTSNVTTMRGMLALCPELTSVIINNQDFSKVTDMGELFMECSGLRLVEFHNCKTGSLYTIDHIFQECLSIKHIDLTGLDFTTVVDFNAAFAHCEDLTSLKIPDLGDGEKKSSFIPMFTLCTSLKESGIECTNIDRLKGL